MQTDSVKYRKENSTDSVDSCAQIELSKTESSSPYTMGASLGHMSRLRACGPVIPRIPRFCRS